ncbi:MAG: enoyl-CoA hydratase/isomerase family protein [Acidimicrobiaceae bacterium]|nr:enoyl-CoA hydratase/isomerase family protein [Ilumatobacter sp.]MCB9382226.1 enoyl-CoA hydratase/isomerase family protein [Acidimicrobiaceae bacterium]MCO5329476.1 enoyl-CoA hydratase-related protein [Ilumatobacteraceae bacterium]
MGMELKAVRYEVDDRVATVWLDRPHRHNAWTGRMHREYLHVLATLEADPEVRAVVVTGTPPAFCVGGDSEALAGHAERGAYDDGLSGELARPAADRPARLDADFAFQFALRLPVIAAVNGACAGVGLALALFCDLRFGSATAKLTTAAPKLGLPAEYGMSWQLPRLVGLTRATDLLLSGRVFTPAETEGWGLWNGVEADGPATLAAAQGYAHHLAHQVGPNALATTKHQIADDLLHHSPAAAIDEAQRLLRDAMTTAEYREGVTALREKRTPRF